MEWKFKKQEETKSENDDGGDGVITQSGGLETCFLLTKSTTPIIRKMVIVGGASKD